MTEQQAAQHVRNLVRRSHLEISIEDAQDLIEDLHEALEERPITESYTVFHKLKDLWILGEFNNRIHLT